LVPFTYEEIVILTVVAGLLAIDERAGWHSLLAQPVFAAALVGLLFGEFVAGLSVGLILELVWLSVLPMRGSRRPDAVAGAVVGAGTACLLIRHTGDPRFVFLVSLCAALGLVCGEVTGTLSRRILALRDRGLGEFIGRVSPETLISRRLAAYLFASLCFVFFSEALLVAGFLPLTVVLAEWITAVAGSPFSTGARVWADLIPALGAGAAIHMYWHKQQNRYVILSAGITLLLLWFR
jgi:mannose/fructose/N-acetylgalactosamine-specific phosphotransferase system component IIC